MIEKALVVIAFLALFGIVGVLIYNEAATNEITVLVDLHDEADPFATLKSIVPVNSSLRSVTEVDRASNRYEIVVRTRQKRKGLLEWFVCNSNVERVELKER